MTLLPSLLHLALVLGPAARVEHFVLLYPPGHPARESFLPESALLVEADPLAAAAGVARWLRADAPEGGHTLECELHLFGVLEGSVPGARDARLLHTEREGLEGPAGRKLVWRELAGPASRSLVVEWPAAEGAPVRLVHSSRGDTLREEWPDARACLPPLGWLEELRTLPEGPPPASVLAPLAVAARRWEAFRWPLAGPVPGLLWVAEVRRADGSLARGLLWAGESLLAFRTGVDAPWAVRVSEERARRTVRSRQPLAATGSSGAPAGSP